MNYIEKGTRLTNKILASFFLFFLFWSGSSFSESGQMFITNYHVTWKIGNNTRVSQNRGIKVLAGDVIPLPILPYHKLELKITEVSSSKFSVDVMILENIRDDILQMDNWKPIISEALRHDGDYGIPMEFSWESGELHLEVAIVVSIASS